MLKAAFLASLAVALPATIAAYDLTGYPESWGDAPGTQKSNPDYLAAYNAIDWSKAPNIPVRVWTDGNPSFEGYDSNSDPDCWWTASICTIPKLSDVNADIYTCPEGDTFGITYDDGPNQNNALLYDFLADNNQLASLFYIGSDVLSYPDRAKAGIDAGHHIAIHTWSHPAMTSQTNEQVFAQLWFTRKILKEVTGYTPKYWRPPYGDVDDRVRWVATQLGLTAIIWNRDSDDWSLDSGTPSASVDKHFQKVIDEENANAFSSSGVIMLEHELSDLTMDMAIKWYPTIKSTFKYVMPVASCMNINNPYVEDYSFPTSQEYINRYYLNQTSSGTGSSTGSSTDSGSSSNSGSSSGSSGSGSGSGTHSGTDTASTEKSGASTFSFPIGLTAAAVLFAGYLLK